MCCALIGNFAIKVVCFSRIVLHPIAQSHVKPWSMREHDTIWVRLFLPFVSVSWDWYCCNLSGGVALIVWFTTNGMCAKNKNICMWREQAIIEWSRRVISIVACCHSAKLCAHAARDFRSQHLSCWGRVLRLPVGNGAFSCYSSSSRTISSLIFLAWEQYKLAQALNSNLISEWLYWRRFKWKKSHLKIPIEL